MKAPPPLRIAFLGLTIPGTPGRGPAMPYGSLAKSLARRGHDVLLLERDLRGDADSRDIASPEFGRAALYRDLDDLASRHAGEIAAADLVIVGSFVPEAAAVSRWVLGTARGTRAFYDLDTPATLTRLQSGEPGPLERAQVPLFDLHLSFTGGPALERLEREFGARRARALHASVDPGQYAPARLLERWDLGYLGTFAGDRQPALERLLIEPARRWFGGRFVVGGANYKADLRWPFNVDRQEHVPPGRQPAFYGSQRWTLHLTRPSLAEAGHSPGPRLFEAAACGAPIIAEPWSGLETFFKPGREILVAKNSDRVLAILADLPDEQRRRISAAARERVMLEHTGGHRAEQLERYVAECRPIAAEPPEPAEPAVLEAAVAVAAAESEAPAP